MTGKTALPNLEDLYRMCQIEFGLIEEAVTEARSHDGTDEQDIKQRL